MPFHGSWSIPSNMGYIHLIYHILGHNQPPTTLKSQKTPKTTQNTQKGSSTARLLHTHAYTHHKRGHPHSPVNNSTSTQITKPPRITNTTSSTLTRHTINTATTHTTTHILNHPRHTPPPINTPRFTLAPHTINRCINPIPQHTIPYQSLKPHIRTRPYAHAE